MPIIEFEGLAENLIPGVKELTDATVKLRSEVAATNDTIKKGAQESLAAEQKLGQTIEATARSMQDLNRESKAAAKSQAEVGKSAAQTAQASTGLVGVFKRMTTGIREFAVGARDGFRTAIKEVGGFRGIVQQAGQNIRNFGLQAKASFEGFANKAAESRGAFAGISGAIGAIFPQIGPLGGAIAGLGGPIGLVATAVGGLVSNLTRLDSVATFVDAIKISFDGLLDRLTSFEGFAGLFDPVQQAKDAAFALQQAKLIDQLGDKERELKVATAETNREIALREQKFRDLTRTDEERRRIADELTQLEQNNAKVEAGVIQERIRLIQREIAEKVRKGQAEDDVSDELKDRLAEEQANLLNAQAATISATEKVERRLNSINEAGAEERVRIAEQEKARREKAAQDLARLEEDLARRGANAVQQTADPAARIELQREQNEAELRLLEQKIKAANEALGKGNKLTLDQELQLADARLAIQLQYEKDRQALELKFAAERIALIADTGERERAAFDLQLAAQIKALEEAGATELEIERFAAKRREDFRAGQVEKAIAQEEALALAKIDAIQKGAETEAQFRIRIELLKLQAQEEFANQRLEALKDQTGEEVELTRAQLEAVLAEIVRKRAEIAANVPEVDIFSLLGLNLTDEQKKRVTDDLKTIGQAVQDAVIANIASQQQGVQAQLDATEQIIEDQRSRKDELIALLDEELEAQKNGFANNADAVRAEIQAVTDAENAALANRKKLVEEQKKLAAQQAKVESALQIAALLTANAYLLKDGALKGVPGTIAAIAFAISLIGTFASIRAKVRAANADTPAFWEGTTYVDKDRKHRTGRDTVPAMLTRGEAVIPVAPNSKYPKLVEGLVENDFAKMQRAAIEELLTGTGVTLKQDRVREIVRTNEKAQSMTIVDRGPDKALLRRVDELTTLLASFKTQEGSKPTTSSDGGRSVVTTPTRTVKRR